MQMELETEVKEEAEIKKAKQEQEEKEEKKEKKEPGFLEDNRGVGVIEIVLILVVLIGLVLVFKEQITAIVNNAFTSISGDATQILK